MSGNQIVSLLPRWKEELVVTGSGGDALILEFSMGIPTVYLPTEAVWAGKAPAWAAGLWPELREALEGWCQFNNAALVIEERAGVWPERT